MDDQDLFKSRRETNRELVSSKMGQKISQLTKQVNALNDQLKHHVEEREEPKLNEPKIVEMGETEYISVEPSSAIVVRIHLTTHLELGMKNIISLTSKDSERGGLIYYLHEIDGSDQCLHVVVENMKEEPRLIKLTYVILQ